VALKHWLPFLGGEYMLISRFKLKDIKDYEAINRCSLLDMLSDFSIVTILEFVKLGNPSVNSDEEAGDILDEYLRTHSLLDAYEEIRKYLTGAEYVQSENSESTETKNYKSLTDLYSKIGVDLRTYDDLSYTEFWNMNVDDLYLEFNLMNDKHSKTKQEKINDMHLQALWNAAAMVGKLDSKPPQLINNTEYEDAEASELDDNALKSMMNIKAFEALYNKGVKQNG
jgi:hypothetical protein